MKCIGFLNVNKKLKCKNTILKIQYDVCRISDTKTVITVFNNILRFLSMHYNPINSFYYAKKSFLILCFFLAIISRKKIKEVYSTPLLFMLLIVVVKYPLLNLQIYTYMNSKFKLSLLSSSLNALLIILLYFRCTNNMVNNIFWH